VEERSGGTGGRRGNESKPVHAAAVGGRRGRQRRGNTRGATTGGGGEGRGSTEAPAATVCHVPRSALPAAASGCGGGRRGRGGHERGRLPRSATTSVGAWSGDGGGARSAIRGASPRNRCDAPARPDSVPCRFLVCVASAGRRADATCPAEVEWKRADQGLGRASLCVTPRPSAVPFHPAIGGDGVPSSQLHVIHGARAASWLGPCLQWHARWCRRRWLSLWAPLEVAVAIPSAGVLPQCAPSGRRWMCSQGACSCTWAAT